MVLINGVKYACERCIRGHRVTTCTHTDQPLMMIKPKGRPSTQCGYCKKQRKIRNSHTACNCSKKINSKVHHDPSCPCHLDGECTCCNKNKKNKKKEKEKELEKQAFSTSKEKSKSKKVNSTTTTTTTAHPPVALSSQPLKTDDSITVSNDMKFVDDESVTSLLQSWDMSSPPMGNSESLASMLSENSTARHPNSAINKENRQIGLDPLQNFRATSHKNGPFQNSQQKQQQPQQQEKSSNAQKGLGEISISVDEYMKPLKKMNVQFNNFLNTLTENSPLNASPLLSPNCLSPFSNSDLNMLNFPTGHQTVNDLNNSNNNNNNNNNDNDKSENNNNDNKNTIDIHSFSDDPALCIPKRKPKYPPHMLDNYNRPDNFLTTTTLNNRRAEEEATLADVHACLHPPPGKGLLDIFNNPNHRLNQNKNTDNNTNKNNNSNNNYNPNQSNTDGTNNNSNNIHSTNTNSNTNNTFHTFNTFNTFNNTNNTFNNADNNQDDEPDSLFPLFPLVGPNYSHDNINDAKTNSRLPEFTMNDVNRGQSPYNLSTYVQQSLNNAPRNEATFSQNPNNNIIDNGYNHNDDDERPLFHNVTGSSIHSATSYHSAHSQHSLHHGSRNNHSHQSHFQPYPQPRRSSSFLSISSKHSIGSSVAGSNAGSYAERPQLLTVVSHDSIKAYNGPQLSNSKTNTTLMDDIYQTKTYTDNQSISSKHVTNNTANPQYQTNQNNQYQLQNNNVSNTNNSFNLNFNVDDDDYIENMGQFDPSVDMSLVGTVPTAGSFFMPENSNAMNNLELNQSSVMAASSQLQQQQRQQLQLQQQQQQQQQFTPNHFPRELDQYDEQLLKSFLDDEF